MDKPMMEALKKRKMGGMPDLTIILGAPGEEGEEMMEDESKTDLAPGEPQPEEEEEMMADGEEDFDLEGLSDYDKKALMEGEPRSLRERSMAERLKKKA